MYKPYRLHLLLALGLLAAYVWLYFSYTHQPLATETSVCIIKHASGYPCPACGSTRSLLELMQGNIGQSALINPIGFLLFFILLFAPFWIAYDVISRQQSMTIFYQKSERIIRQKAIGIPLISLVLANWIWNIYKGL